FRPTGFPLRPPRSLVLGCFFCRATPTPLPRYPCAPPYSSSRLSPPTVLPFLAKACPSAASLSLFSRRVSDKSPSFLSHSSVNRRAPSSILSYHSSALLALASH
ncbi:unnamed protein product, partial [Pylaiella littoralis]